AKGGRLHRNGGQYRAARGVDHRHIVPATIAHVDVGLVGRDSSPPRSGSHGYGVYHRRSGDINHRDGVTAQVGHIGKWTGSDTYGQAEDRAAATRAVATGPATVRCPVEVPVSGLDQ